MRILALIPQLGPGGAERVMSQLVAHLADRHEVVLLTWEASTTAPFYPIPPAARVVRTDLFGGVGVKRLTRIVERVAIVRNQVLSFRPDVVLSFLDAMNMVALSACIGTRVPVVISERIDPGQHDIGRFKNVMRWMLYPLSKRLVVQTRQIADYFPDRLRPKISVVPNPIKVPTVQARPQQPAIDGRFKVVAAGRLTYQKAFDTLVAAYALVADHFQDWDLTIFGEGEERLWLERNIQERGLSKRVSLPGLRSDLQSELSNAHILAFPSRYEGFPNILAEGQAVGLPAVAYQKVSGVEDIVVDGQTGILVPAHQDHGAFAEALSMLMADAKQRLRMGAAARRNAEQWSPSAIFSSWDTVLARAASINERN